MRTVLSDLYGAVVFVEYADVPECVKQLHLRWSYDAKSWARKLTRQLMMTTMTLPTMFS